MSSRLIDRLNSTRRRRFIGRSAELALFSGALAAAEPPFFVLYVHGPGGVGKTALLAQFAHLAQAAGVTAVTLDARNLEPTAAAFQGNLSLALGIDPGQSPIEALTQRTGRAVILVDTYELMAPLDDWLVFHIVFGKTVPDVSLNAIANLGYAEGRFGREQEIEVGHYSGESNVIYWLRKRGIEPTAELVAAVFGAAGAVPAGGDCRPYADHAARRDGRMPDGQPWPPDHRYRAGD